MFDVAIAQLISPSASNENLLLGFKGEANIIKELQVQSSQRLLVIGESLRQGVEKDKINKITKYDPWFIEQVNSIIQLENTIKKIN